MFAWTDMLRRRCSNGAEKDLVTASGTVVWTVMLRCTVKETSVLFAKVKSLKSEKMGVGHGTMPVQYGACPRDAYSVG
jgi:hypothetical protein